MYPRGFIPQGVQLSRYAPPGVQLSRYAPQGVILPSCWVWYTPRHAGCGILPVMLGVLLSRPAGCTTLPSCWVLLTLPSCWVVNSPVLLGVDHSSVLLGVDHAPVSLLVEKECRKAYNPATESACAQGEIYLSTPVSLLGKSNTSFTRFTVGLA